MKILIIVSIILCNLNPGLFAQEVLWHQHWDGSASYNDLANSHCTDESGKIYVTGLGFNSNGIGRFTNLIFSPEGDLLHSVQYGTADNNEGRRICRGQDGRVYAVGILSENEGDVAVACLQDDLLNPGAWINTYEPYWFGSGTDTGIDIACGTDGNLYVVGQSTSLEGNMDDVFILKLSSEGVLDWSTTYTGASAADHPVAIALGPEMEVYTLASSYNFFGSASYDIVTMQYLPGGIQNWISSYNGPQGGYDTAICLEIDEQNNQYIGGRTSDNDGRLVAIKQNQYGTRLWEYLYDGSAEGIDETTAVSDLGGTLAVISGTSFELSQSETLSSSYTCVVDSGILVWENSYLGSEAQGAFSSGHLVTASSTILAFGYENTNDQGENGLLVHYDLSGNILWELSFDHGNNLNDRFHSINLHEDGTITLSGTTELTAGNDAILVLKLDPGVASSTDNLEFKPMLMVYPNPTSDILSIAMNVTSAAELTLHSMEGRIVSHEQFSGSHEQVHMSLRALPSGTYLLRVETEDGLQFRRVVKVD